LSSIYAPQKQVGVLGDQEALETILPKVARMAIAALIGEGVREIQSMHGVAQPHCRRRFRDEMDVVGHEAVMVEMNLMREEIPMKQLAVPLLVFRVEKDRHPVVPPRQEMVTATIQEKSRCAWHGQ